ncbi:MAG: PilZ domain-containing protein [Acidobacteriota bacterium]
MISFSRRSRRFKVNGRFAVRLEGQGRRLEGRLVSLSAHGAYVEMSSELRERETVSLELDLPKPALRPLSFQCTVVWCNRPRAPEAPGLPEGCALSFLPDRTVMMNALDAVKVLRATGHLSRQNSSTALPAC